MSAIYIFSGPDRAGKSTTIHRLSQDFPRSKVIHYGPVPPNHSDIQAYHRNPILQWDQTGPLFLDRSYVCYSLLGPIRHGTDSHLDEVVDFEYWLYGLGVPVLHVGIVTPWSVVAHHHFLELETANPKASTWHTRNSYIARMREHKAYCNDLRTFYAEVTAFPSILTEEPSTLTVSNLSNASLRPSFSSSIWRPQSR